MTHKVGTKQKEFLFDRNKIILVKELHNELRSLLIVCQIFGAAPPVCDFPDVLLDSKPTNQRIAKALNWIWSLTIIAAIITATQFHKFHIDDTSSILTHTIYACEYVLAITMCIVSILGGKLLHNKYYLILNQMIEVDLVLLRLGVKPKYQQISRSIKKFYAASVCFLIVNISVAADHTKWDPFVTLQMVTIYVLPNIPWTLCIVQFVVVMCHLSYNYEDINSILEGVAADGRNFPTIYITENKTLNIFNEKSNAQAKIIETLRKLHVSLNKIVNLLCNCFGIFLCGTILTGFLTLIVELFHLYRAEEGLLDYKYHQYGYTVLWVIVFGGRIFAVLFISEKVSCAVSFVINHKKIHLEPES